MPSYDVVGIGNAIVDIVAECSDDLLDTIGSEKGSMALVDLDQIAGLGERITPTVQMSGGSCANTLAGVASLGGRTGFIGKVRDDEFGDTFRQEILAAGTDFPTDAGKNGEATARCIVLVTPDAQRTMHTYLGIAGDISVADIDSELVSNTKVLYVEGYLWDSPQTKEAIVTAMAQAKAAGGNVSFTLSDAFCVDRFREEFIELARDHVDVLFANEVEALSLTGAATLDAAIDEMAGLCEIVAVTRSENGSVIAQGDSRVVVAAQPVEKVVDTTGAGDAYAAGFLYGLTQDQSLKRSGEIGSIAAAQVISDFGPRSGVPLSSLL